MALSKTVLIVDDDADLRAAMGDVIEGIFGLRCLGAASLEDTVALGSRALSCSTAIVDINLGADRPSGLDTVAWLMEQRYAGRIAFLTGHARSHPLVERARRIGQVHVYEKPVSLEQLEELLR
jgi:ActR/RegA family two-component response regulator